MESYYRRGLQSLVQLGSTGRLEKRRKRSDKQELSRNLTDNSIACFNQCTMQVNVVNQTFHLIDTQEKTRFFNQISLGVGVLRLSRNGETETGIRIGDWML